MTGSEDLFRDLCENANDLIQSVTPEGRFLYVNLAWMKTLGYSSEEVDGLSVFDTIHPDSHLHCMSLMSKLLRGEEIGTLTADFRAKDGRRVPVEGSARCTFEDGRPMATRGIFRDITLRKAAEAERDRLFTMSVDLLCVAGTDGFFKEVNPAFERVLGYTTTELLSRGYLEFIHPEDRAESQHEVERLGQGLATVDFQNRFCSRDGSWRWISWRATPWPERGLIYAVGRDVTEQKRIEAVLDRQSAELARSNSDLEQFAYVASHDLRAPLQAIVTLSEWIEEEVAQGDREKAAAHLHQLRARSHRMSTMINDLLEYARAGRRRMEPERVDTAELLRDLVDLISPPSSFKIEVGAGLPVLETPRGPLEQVLRNLITNAIKHHDRPEGTVRIEARMDEKSGCVFTVRDDGPGIEPKFHERIFHMFEKLRSRDEVEGSGIGLALVKRIVEGQGGRVWIEAAEGRGASFHFTWPAASTAGVDRAENPHR